MSSHTVATFRSALRLSVLYGAIFMTFGIALPYFPLWLEARGLDPATIGLLLSISPLVRVAATPWMAGLADRRLSPAGLLIIGQAASVVFLAVLAIAPGPWAIAACIMVVALAQTPLVPVTDALALQAIRADPVLHYGRLRLWASVTFIVANLAGGAALSAHGPGFVVWAQMACALAGLAAALWVRSIPTAAPTARVVADLSLPAQAGTGSLGLIIAASAAIQCSHAALYGFGSLLWTGQGFSGAAIGVFWAVGIMVEVVLLYTVRATGRSVAWCIGLMAVGGGAALVRWTALSLDLGFAATCAAQALHGLTFAATHLGVVGALDALSPSQRRARTQGVHAAVTAAAMAGMTAAAGYAFAVAPAASLLLMAVPAGAGLVLLALVRLRISAAPDRPAA